MKRGDIVIVSAPGDYGKPRPALVVQADLLNESHASIIVCPFTSKLVQAPLLRITVKLSPANGLERTSQIMVDKLITMRREKLGQRIGSLDRGTMHKVEQSLLFVLGFAQKE